MKIGKYFLVAMTMFGVNSYADGLKVLIHVKAKDRYLMQADGSAKGIDSTSASTVSIDGDFGGEKFSQQVGPENRVETLSMNISDIEKETIRFIDNSQAVNLIARAKVDKTLFGKIKKISVTSEDVKSIFAQALQKSNSTLIERVKSSHQNGSIEVETEFSDYVCQRESDALFCDIEMNMKIEMLTK